MIGQQVVATVTLDDSGLRLAYENPLVLSYPLFDGFLDFSLDLLLDQLLDRLDSLRLSA